MRRLGWGMARGLGRRMEREMQQAAVRGTRAAPARAHPAAGRRRRGGHGISSWPVYWPQCWLTQWKRSQQATHLNLCKRHPKILNDIFIIFQVIYSCQSTKAWDDQPPPLDCFFSPFPLFPLPCAAGRHAQVCYHESHDRAHRASDPRPWRSNEDCQRHVD